MIFVCEYEGECVQCAFNERESAAYLNLYTNIYTNKILIRPPLFASHTHPHNSSRKSENLGRTGTLTTHTHFTLYSLSLYHYPSMCAF